MILKQIALISVCCFLYVGCNQQSTSDQAENTGSEVRVVQEYHPNGRLKTSTEAVGNLRHGISREYRSDGTLENEIHFIQNRKHGPAKNYYADGTTVKLEVNYENGYKQGETKWYFPSGKIYRITSYENNMIEGIRRIYWENGNIQAELPYHADQPGMGLREYTQEGKLKDYAGVIQVREEDRISLDNSYTLVLSISDGTRNVEFFTGSLTDGIYWNEQLSPVTTENGTGRMVLDVPRGTFKMETINLVARIETSPGQIRILRKEYHLAVENPI
jgi:hypothetical protein